MMVALFFADCYFLLGICWKSFKNSHSHLLFYFEEFKKTSFWNLIIIIRM